MLSRFSRVQLHAALWTVALQAPLSMGFSRQEYWCGLPFPSPGDLPNPEIEPGSPALQADALTSELPGKQAKWIFILLYKCFVQILWRWRLRWRTGCRWWGKGYLSIEALYAFKQKSTLHLEVVVVYLFVLALACFPGLIRNILKWEFYFVYFSCLS